MKRVVWGTLIVLLAFTTMASATRVTTMGGVNNIVKDVQNIFIYPQSLTDYPDQMWLQVNGAGNLHSLGAHYAIGGGTLGMYFTTDNLASTYAPGVPNNLGGTNFTYDQKINLFYACDGFGFPVGAQLSLYGDSHSVDKTTAPEDKSVESVMGLGIDLGATFIDVLDAYFTFHTVTWKHEDADGKTISEPNGNTIIGFGGRFWMEMSDTYTLIPYASLTLSGEGKKDSSKVKTSTTAINIGVGDNINIADNIMAVSDLGISFAPSKTETERPNQPNSETKQSNNALPYFRVGLEAEVTSWMDVRFGAFKGWQGRTNEDNNGDKESWGWADTDLYLGAGFHFNNLVIDAQINPGFITRGPYIISGAGGNMFARASIAYIWGE